MLTPLIGDKALYIYTCTHMTRHKVKLLIKARVTSHHCHAKRHYRPPRSRGENLCAEY